MRTVPNTFIFNLAVGDLLVLLFTVPFTSTVYTFESWPFGEFICKASEFFKVTYSLRMSHFEREQTRREKRQHLVVTLVFRRSATGRFLSRIERSVNRKES